MGIALTRQRQTEDESASVGVANSGSTPTTMFILDCEVAGANAVQVNPLVRRFIEYKGIAIGFYSGRPGRCYL